MHLFTFHDYSTKNFSGGQIIDKYNQLIQKMEAVNTLPSSRFIQLSFHAGSHPLRVGLFCQSARKRHVIRQGYNHLLLVRRSDFLNHVLQVVQGRGINDEAVVIEGGLVKVVGEAVLEPGLHALVGHGLDAGELLDLLEQGLQFVGITMQGDAATMANQMGLEGTALSFATGGKCTAFGSETTYVVGTDGASITDEGLKMPLKMLDGQLVIDMGSAYGMDFSLIFTKA